VTEDAAPEPTAEPAPAASAPGWRSFADRNALWLALGALAVAGGLLAVGIQLDPGTFYDHYWWPDIYGPLVVDAHQCPTDANCPGISADHPVRAADNYTVKSELTYGVVLALLLYGIYVGLFRRYQIRVDGWFIASLAPWLLLGPVGRVLEDANVFCPANTVPCASPSLFSFLYISPVIYVQIALYVIGAMLLGLAAQRRPERGWRSQTAFVAVPLLLGLALFGALDATRSRWFSVLPPFWFVALVCVLAAGLYAWRAAGGFGTANAAVFALGLPFAASAVFLVLSWLAGQVWSPAAWASGAFYRLAGAFVLMIAILVAVVVWALARLLTAWRVDERWAAVAGKASADATRRVGWIGGLLAALGFLVAGIVPNLTPFFDGVPDKPLVIPLLILVGSALLAVFAFLEIGRGIAVRPGSLLVFAAGLNVAMVFAHVLDGMATWVALDDPLGFGVPPYSEKHPFSEALLGYWGGALYPVAKLVMVLVVAWLLDKETASAGPDERNLVGLVKMAIFALGFGPGLRDLLRLSMGV
jgi:uncharacterized membrane protein